MLIFTNYFQNNLLDHRLQTRKYNTISFNNPMLRIKERYKYINNILYDH